MDALTAWRMTQPRPVDAWAARSAFLSSAAAETLGPMPDWTVSDADKRPIDLGSLQDRLVLWGARPNDPTATVTLADLVRILPDARNAAFHLDSETSGLCVLDVEPTCPADERAPMLAFPYLWAETSMSGHGIHLVLPVPKAISQDPDAASSLAVKDPKGRYEVLLCHWVTFTGNPLAAPAANPMGSMKAWEAFAADLVERAPNRSVHDSLGPMDPNLEPVRDLSWMMARDLAIQRPYPKGPSDFDGDMSRFEFGFLSWTARRLRAVLTGLGVELDLDMEAMLLWDCAKARLDYRPKHDELRVGIPWLLYQARNAIASMELQERDSR